MLYKKQCAPCHGILGDGNGFLAAGFDVKPRDFRQGTYKFRSTKTGELPTMEDLEHSIRVGVPTTTMPAWGQFLSKDEIHDVARYLITFSEKFTEAWKNSVKPEMLRVPQPPENLSTMASKGKELFGVAQCALCHGEAGKGDGPSAADMKDDWDNPIQPTDLTYEWLFKNGSTARDIYRTFNGALNGTPMPSYSDTFDKEEDRWALVSYILSLSPEHRPVLHMNEFKQKFASVRDENGIIRK
jgi:cytochrome c oxidase cbb3-type subunit 2